MRVEVGYVELLHGTAATVDERTRLIAEANERRRIPPVRREVAAVRDLAARATAQDRDTMQAMLADAERSDAPADDGEGVAVDLPVAHFKHVPGKEHRDTKTLIPSERPLPQ